MVPSIVIWTALQFADFHRIFSQSPESMERSRNVHYILINTAGFTKICLLLTNHLNRLTPELNSSAQRCLTRFLLVILLLDPAFL
jgi:hypothetical protein